MFAGANDTHRIVGECSTSYLWSPSAPAALKAAHPDAKIVVSLRDPIARIYSHYLMARKYGFVKGSVVEAVKADLAHPDPSWGRSELFVELSLYDAQIARWRAHFPDDQLLVLEPGALRRDETWHDLQTWLGLTPRDLSDTGGSGDANTAGLSRFEGLNRFLTASGLKHVLARLVPSGVKQQRARGAPPRRGQRGCAAGIFKFLVRFKKCFATGIFPDIHEHLRLFVVRDFFHEKRKRELFSSLTN